MTSPLDYLRKHAIDPGLCRPNHKAIKAGRRALANLTTPFVRSTFTMLATKDVLSFARSTLFGLRLPRISWPLLLAKASNLAALMPDLLCDPGLVSPPAPESLDTLEKLTNYCIGLVSRPAAKAGNDTLKDTAASVIAPLGITLASQAQALFRLRSSHPQIFAGVIADDGTAILSAMGIPDERERHSIIKTIERQWLLCRAFHLQRGVAYVTAATRAAMTAPLQAALQCRFTVTATAAAAYVDTLAQGSDRSFAGYERWLLTRGKAKTPGCTSRPVDFVTALVERPWTRLKRESQIRIHTALSLSYGAIWSKIPSVLAVKAEGIAGGLKAKADLHRAAGVMPPDERRLLLFEIWHHGLSPAALLLVLAIRYGEAAAIAQVILQDPDKAFESNSSDFKIRPTRANAEAIARDMAAAIIGADWPSLDNTEKNFKLALECIGRHGSGCPVHRGWADERLKFDALDPLHNALPPHLKNLPGTLHRRRPRRATIDVIDQTRVAGLRYAVGGFHIRFERLELRASQIRKSDPPV